MGTVIEGRKLRCYVYVWFFWGGLLLTVEFINVHDIHIRKGAKIDFICNSN